MQQGPRGDPVVVMRRKPRIGDGRNRIAAAQIRGDGAGMVEMALHARGHRVQPAPDRDEVAGPDGGRIRNLGNQGCQSCVVQGVALMGRHRSGIHGRPVRTRPRHRDGLAAQIAGGDAVERLEAEVGAELERPAAEQRRHGVVHDERGTRPMGGGGERAQVGNAQTPSANCIREPEDTPLPRCGGGGGQKGIGRRIFGETEGFPGEPIGEGIREIVGERDQMIAGPDDPKLRQPIGHVPGGDEAHTPGSRLSRIALLELMLRNGHGVRPLRITRNRQRPV